MPGGKKKERRTEERNQKGGFEFGEHVPLAAPGAAKRRHEDEKRKEKNMDEEAIGGQRAKQRGPSKGPREAENEKTRTPFGKGASKKSPKVKGRGGEETKRKEMPDSIDDHSGSQELIWKMQHEQERIGRKEEQKSRMGDELSLEELEDDSREASRSVFASVAKPIVRPGTAQQIGKGKEG